MRKKPTGTWVKLRPFDWSNMIISVAAICIALLSAPKSPMKMWLSESAGLRFTSTHYEFWNTVLFSISSSTLLSIVLFYLLSRFPHLKAQAANRRSLHRSFRIFKLSCIEIFVVISGYPQDINYEDLLEVRRFREAFKTEKHPRHYYWYDVASGLNKYYLTLLSHHLEELREEVKRQSNNIDIYSEADREQLEAFARHLKLIQTHQDDYDSVKSMCGSMWSIFTSWDFIEGYPKSDRLSDLLNNI